MSRPIRLSDVAKAAGVSLATASKTFSKPERVRLETRQRVEEAAAQLGYAGPNPKGRLLMGGKVHAVGVVTANPLGFFFYDPFNRDFMIGFTEVCAEAGAGVALISAQADDVGGWGVGSAVVDGFVLIALADPTGPVELAKRRRLPFVTVDFEVGPEASSLRVDDRGGARMAVEHLLGLGHRRFGILSIILTDESRTADLSRPVLVDSEHRLRATIPVTRERLLGYADGLAAAGISIDDVPIIEVQKGWQGSAVGASLLLDTAPEATGVLAMADIIALGFLEEARRRGINIPRDLSVVGFDGTPDGATSEPPLTSIEQPGKEKGRRAAELILSSGEHRHEVLPVKLLVRSSTAAPRAN
jgi:DNA-binding LacI/PurR family transcriptional regulator